MDEELPSDPYRKWAVIRGLLQAIVILIGAFGLWLIGAGPHRDETLPFETGLPLTTPPAAVSFAPAPPTRPTTIVAAPDARVTATSQDVRAVPLDGADQAAGPTEDAAGTAPTRPTAAQGEDVGPQDASPQETGPQDVASPAAAPQNVGPRPVGSPPVPVQAGGESLGPIREGGGDVSSDVFLSILPTPVPSPVFPEPPETTNRWVWPVRGEISQGYSSEHRAIDISNELGAVVVAADAGTVVYARWESSGYGYFVLIDHHNGFASYYAHLYGFYIDVGAGVARGEQIGELGTTGRSTGPHLHFEIRQDGVQRNPLDLLP